jgi:hypothetical protein
MLYGTKIFFEREIVSIEDINKTNVTFAIRSAAITVQTIKNE